MSPQPRKQAREEKRDDGRGGNDASSQSNKALGNRKGYTCRKNGGTNGKPSNSGSRQVTVAKSVDFVDRKPTPVERILIKERQRCGTYLTTTIEQSAEPGASEGCVPTPLKSQRLGSLERCYEQEPVVVSVNPSGSHYLIINENNDAFITNADNAKKTAFEFKGPNGEDYQLQQEHKKARHIQWSPDGKCVIVFFQRDAPDRPNIWVGNFDSSTGVLSCQGVINYGRLMKNQWPYFKFTLDSKYAISCTRDSINIFHSKDQDLDLIDSLTTIANPGGKGHIVLDSFIAPRVDQGILRIWFQTTETPNIDTSHPETRMVLSLLEYDIKTETTTFPHKIPIGASDRTEWRWNATGSHALVLNHCVVDLEQGNYGGTTNLHVLANGTHTYTRINEEMVCDAMWNPSNHLEFIMIEGRARNKITARQVKNGKIAVSHEFPNGYKNTIRYGPFGNIVLIGGYGQMAGDTAIFYKPDSKKPHYEAINEWREDCCVKVEWSPSGRNLMMASTHPRMKVDNCVRVFSSAGDLLTQYRSSVILDAIWLGESSSFLPPQRPICAIVAPPAAQQGYRPKSLKTTDATRQSDNAFMVAGPRLDAIASNIKSRRPNAINATSTATAKTVFVPGTAAGAPRIGPRPDDPARAAIWDKKMSKWKEVSDASTWKKGTKTGVKRPSDVKPEDACPVESNERERAEFENKTPDLPNAPGVATARPSIGQQLTQEHQLLQARNGNGVKLNKPAGMVNQKFTEAQQQQQLHQQAMAHRQAAAQQQLQIAAVYQQHMQQQQIQQQQLPTPEMCEAARKSGNTRLLAEYQQALEMARRAEVINHQRAMYHAANYAMGMSYQQQQQTELVPEMVPELGRGKPAQIMMEEKSQYCRYGANESASNAIFAPRGQQEVDYIEFLINPLVDDCWFYIDPQNKVQGPFSLVNMRNWYNNKFLRDDLKIKCMPHHPFVEMGTFFADSIARQIPTFHEEAVLASIPRLRMRRFTLPPFKAQKQA